MRCEFNGIFSIVDVYSIPQFPQGGKNGHTVYFVTNKCSCSWLRQVEILDIIEAVKANWPIDIFLNVYKNEI